MWHSSQRNCRTFWIDMRPENACSAASSPWIARFAPLIPAGGEVLDLACGAGRHARLLAGMGYRVEAVDRDADALATLADVANVTTRRADLEGGPWPYYADVFDGIVVSRYLWRPLFPRIFNCLAEGGVLIYETFMEGQQLYGKPSNPAFLLRPGELLEVIGKRFTVVAFEQGEIVGTDGNPQMIQRICVRRGRPTLLP
jgi:SAM-dependent methyltransferase